MQEPIHANTPNFNNEPYRSISGIESCLAGVKAAIKKKNHLAKIQDSWRTLVGEKLSENCQPIRLNQGVLVIGAEYPQWRQALMYNRMKLLSSIRAAGHDVRELKIQQYYPNKVNKNSEDELSIWERHPSRIDVHGIAKCSSCGIPAPAGEMAFWGTCSLCRQIELSNRKFTNN